MRLKYFLRGVGVGVIVTTLILTIAHNANRQMSDNEIIERARELGMAFGVPAQTEPQQPSGEETTGLPWGTSGSEEPDTMDTSMDVSMEASMEASTEASGEDQTTGEDMTQETTEGKTTEAGTTTEAEGETETTTTAVKEQETTQPQETTDFEASETEPAGDVIQYTLTIVSGMSSNTVARILLENGIIEDAQDFNDFMERNGYAERIRVGSFAVNSAMSYEELAGVFCSR